MIRTRAALALMAFGALMMLGTGLARADTNDDDIYLTVLRDRHVAPTITDASKLQEAQAVCGAYVAGWGDADVISGVVADGKGMLTRTDAAYLVGAAVATYCPKYNGDIPSRSGMTSNPELPKETASPTYCPKESVL